MLFKRYSKNFNFIAFKLKFPQSILTINILTTIFYNHNNGERKKIIWLCEKEHGERVKGQALRL